MKNTKYYRFTYSGAEDIVAAEHAREAFNFFLNSYIDDLQLGDAIEDEPMEIEELDETESEKIRPIFNEELGDIEHTSYKEIAKEMVLPNVIVCYQL